MAPDMGVTKTSPTRSYNSEVTTSTDNSVRDLDNYLDKASPLLEAPVLPLLEVTTPKASLWPPQFPKTSRLEAQTVHHNHDVYYIMTI
jgi:hypothetical protein